MKNIKYIVLSLLVAVMFSCENEELDELRNLGNEDSGPLPALTAGTADFSKYVSIGNSLTAGFSDGTVFLAAQQNSFPTILSQQFSLIGSGEFTQPLVNDNFGGLALAGNRIANPRFVTVGGPPTPLESVIGPVTVSTDIVLNNPTGPFNNMGVPGAASFHLNLPGYGNIVNLPGGPAVSNPYFVRMTGATPDATIMDLAMAQAPSFVTLWIGANDVLGYATGGAANGAPTSQPIFDGAIAQIMSELGDVQGVMANIPNVSDLPYFTTINYDRLDPTDPGFGAQIPTLNGIFSQLNQVFAFLESQGIPNATERSIVFSETENSSFVIRDESLMDLSAQITGVLNASPTFPAFVESFGLPAAAAPQVAGLFGLVYGQARQATANDLLVLTSGGVLGSVNEDFAAFLGTQGLPPTLAGQFAVEGITLPLEDKWVLIPSEITEISTAISGFNATLQAAASAAGFGFVDANAIFEQMATTGYTDGNFTVTTDLILGGAVSLDGVHPTSRGYALVANEFMKAIDAAYGSNFEASGNLVDIGDYPTNYSPLLQ